MNIADLLKRKPKQLDGVAEGEEGASVEDLQANDTAHKKQILLLSAGAAVMVVLGSMWVTSGDEKAADTALDGSKEVKVSAPDMVNRNMSEHEWMAASESRFQGIDNQLKSVDGQAAQMDRLQAQLSALQGENQSMASDGQRVVSAYQSENDQLRAQLAAAKSAPVAPPPVPGPAAMYGARGPGSYTPAGGAAATPQGAAAMAAVAASRGIKMVSFEGGSAGNGTRIAGGSTSYTDSPNYLPPNSIAKAKVIVGVDASAGVNSQSDPLPVVLRITGPARSVYRDGKLLTTRIEGCLINGAARGDLSSEKVYVKLQRMTCPQANGRYAVSDVKGFIAFGGKTGVRGRVVSREGSLATQAFLAGLVGGFGRGFSTNANSVFSGATNVITGGKRDKLSGSEIAQGGLGQGVSEAGDMVSKYLIERAEQYQPVVEMPTGIDVEIVFLEGVFIQN
jgi:conjugal transfer pilus assembly protein TraB